jgi:hypothetical protein
MKLKKEGRREKRSREEKALAFFYIEIIPIVFIIVEKKCSEVV